MLTEKRIHEAKTNIKNYQKDGLLKQEKYRREILNIYLKNFKESINLAKAIFESKQSSLWTIIISYYSMFYMANAVLYKLGYKVGHKIAHKVTADALIVFVKDTLKESLLEQYENAAIEAISLSETLIENFDRERVKRARFQYETTEEIKYAKAKTSINRAIQFGFEMQKLLIKNK